MSEETKVEHDVKNTKELIVISFRIAGVIKKIARNGLGAEDLITLVEEAKAMDLYIEGFSDLDMLDDEIKDLDEKEAVELLMTVISGVKSFKEA